MLWSVNGHSCSAVGIEPIFRGKTLGLEALPFAAGHDFASHYILAGLEAQLKMGQILPYGPVARAPMLMHEAFPIACIHEFMYREQPGHISHLHICHCNALMAAMARPIWRRKEIHEKEARGAPFL